MSANPISYTNKDYASLLAALQQFASQQMPEWTDQSPNDVGVMLLELFCAMGDALFYNMDRIAGESFLATAVERRSVMNHLRLIGYELRAPLSASADLTLLFDPSATGSVTISQFAAFKTSAPGTALTFQYILTTPVVIDRGSLPFGLVDATGNVTVLPAGQTPTPPAGSTAYRAYQTLPVVQVDANVTNEILGSSDGSANQTFSLQRAPVIDDTLVVSVDEGAGPVVWTKVSSLLQSGPNDNVYQVRRDENETVWIEFGGPPYGRAPLAGVLNNISASYCAGGGVKGNVGANAISKPVTAIDKLKLVANLVPASGGADAEDSASAAQRAPQQFRSGNRAVTAADYVTLAQTFGFAKAQAQAAGWNRVRVVVAPEGGGQPSSTQVEDFQQFLAPKIMLGTQVDISGPLFTPLYLDVTVYYIPQYSAALIQQQVAQAVAAQLAFDTLTFNQHLYVSKIYEVIQEIDGVAGVNITTFAKGATYQAGSLPSTGQLIFGQVDPSELPQWQGFDGKTSTLTLTPGSGP
jgi:uncharacterized phage protein gp47/JayE